MPSNFDLIRQVQKESLKKKKEEFEKAKAEYENYLESEQYQRDLWENGQDFWEKKAKREGWAYTRQPFVSAADRQRMAQESKEQEIAYLEEKIAALKNGE